MKLAEGSEARQDGISVSLTPGELWGIRQIAHARNDPKIGVVRNRKVDAKQSDIDIHVKGIKAEYAVGKLFGVPFDTTISLAGDGGVLDLYIGDLTCQVKYNSYPNGVYRMNGVDDFKTDIGILVVPTDSSNQGGYRNKSWGDDVVVIGWLTKEDFRLKYQLLDFGHGPRACVEQKDLRSIRQLQGLVDFHAQMAKAVQIAAYKNLDPWELMRDAYKRGWYGANTEGVDT